MNKNTRIQAAAGRILAFGVQDQIQEVQQKVSAELYSIVHSLWMIDGLQVARAVVTSPPGSNTETVNVTFSAQELNEDQLDDIGRVVQNARSSLAGFWVTLRLKDSTIEIGGEA